MTKERKSSSDEDREWISGYLLSGNQKYLTSLEEKYHYPLLNHIRLMVGDTPKSEDLLQEVFTNVFGKLSTYNPKYAFSTWLFNIARNRCIDHLRKEKSLQRKHTAGSIGELVPNNDHPYDHEVSLQDHKPVENHPDMARMMEELTMALPLKYREVFRLRHMDGLRYKQIAQTLNLPEGTVKTYLFRAKKHLSTQAKSKRNA